MRCPDVTTWVVGSVLNGFDAIELLRSNPATQALPIIALSASVFDHDRRRSQLSGANDFIAKPIRAEHLLASIQHQLGLTWCYAGPSSTALQALERPARPTRTQPMAT
ncbi:MAG: hypothetical protein AAFX99_24600, partial [Myxococcota bacterium]